MLKGLSLSALAAKIENNQAAKNDFIVPTEAATMRVESDGKLVLDVDNASLRKTNADRNDDHFGIRDLAHEQIAGRLQIPQKYYDRMRENDPELLATNVNAWFRSAPEKRMIRTMSGDVRAFLSNRYNRIENEEIAAVVLPILAEIPDVKIVSSEITERRMYIQAVSPRTTSVVKVGDVVQAGVIISNSETGHGAVNVMPLMYRLVCLNGMISQDGKLRANHVGGRIEETESLYADDTRQADDRAILLKVRDHVRSAVDAVSFERRVDSLRTLTEVKIGGNPERVVEALAKKVGANESERGGILRSLIEGADLSAWGLLNALTHQAHTATGYDRSVEFERMGGQLLELPRSQWVELLEAA